MQKYKFSIEYHEVHLPETCKKRNKLCKEKLNVYIATDIKFLTKFMVCIIKMEKYHGKMSGLLLMCVFYSVCL